MAEIRKHNPGLDPIALAVRAALGEDVRPVEPGSITPPREPDPFDIGDRRPTVGSAPLSPAAGPAGLGAAGGPLIGALPSSGSWFVSTPPATPAGPAAEPAPEGQD